jgi:hypothetical protein
MSLEALLGATLTTSSGEEVQAFKRELYSDFI